MTEADNWAALIPAGVEPRTEVGACAERDRLVGELRQFADFLERNLSVPVPRNGYMPLNVFAVGSDEAQRAQVDHVSSIMGAPVVDNTGAGGHYLTSQRFGTVEYRFVSIPDEAEAASSPGYAIGQEVRLAPVPARAFRQSEIGQAGVITGTEPAGSGETWYEVSVPGPYTFTLPGTMLEPVSLGEVATSRGPVTKIADAEARLVEVAVSCRLRKGIGLPPAQADAADLDALSGALAETCGLPRSVLLTQLGGRIEAELDKLRCARRATERAIRAARAGQRR